MKQRISLWKFCLFGGAGLILLAVVFMLRIHSGASAAAERMASYMERIRKAMPEVTDRFPAPDGDPDLPALELDGHDFIGILEFPDYQAVFPVCGTWDVWFSDGCPSRFKGNVRERSLVIGASNLEGQCTFSQLLGTGDTICFTDLTGSRSTYRVTSLRKLRRLSAPVINGEEDDLVFFVREVFSLDYVVASCELVS